MKRSFFAHEVIQTSATDCGPAALKALFAGFDIYLSYGRLREACQTDVDGTSIDTLETLAQALGLDVEQRMMPVDLLLLESSECLPAIVVVRLPDGAPHFVVLWRVQGAFVQIMDPAAGRIWMRRRTFLDALYIHEQAVPREAWDEWSASKVFESGLDRRMRALGVTVNTVGDRARLDAALRLAQAVRDARALRGRRATSEFLRLCEANPDQIPPEYWTVRTVASDTDRICMRGAVLVSTSGRRTDPPLDSLPDSLAAVRREPAPRVWAPVRAALRADGRAFAAAIAGALIAAAAAIVLEVALFRSLIDLARHLTLSGQRLVALALVVAFAGGLLALEWPATTGLLRLGRHLELRLRLRFLLKIPRLNDRYFQSRLISDMAFRAHSLQLLRQLPELAGQFVQWTATLVCTLAAIAWLYPRALWPAVFAVLAAVGVPLLFEPALVERDLRLRETTAALSRFYLDALLGTRAVEAHAAARTLLAAQAPQLAQWANAGLRQQALVVQAQAVQVTLALASVVWLVAREAAGGPRSAGLLLLTYWALSIPSIGHQIASFVWSLPALHNTLLRFLEPLGADEETVEDAEAARGRPGVTIDIDHASAIAAGQVILDRVSLHVASGEHVGIVGLSGAGKSSLVGLLLGWHKPVHGRVLIDDAPLDASRLAQLRRELAWIDPQVHVFRATLFDNLRYGNGEEAAAAMGTAIDRAGLVGILQRLPNGLQTSLGEGGATVSGGEGQRVRIGRALARSEVRLAILDEPARGLDRDERRRFLADARTYFAGATILAITHDISDTLDFDRVLVVQDGCILEQGSPKALFENARSRYRALIDREQEVHRDLWSHPRWRRLRMRGGRLSEDEGRPWTPA